MQAWFRKKEIKKGEETDKSGEAEESGNLRKQDVILFKSLCAHSRRGRTMKLENLLLLSKHLGKIIL